MTRANEANNSLCGQLKRSIAVALLGAFLMFALMPATAWASSTVSMTVYHDTVKTGNTVFCASPGAGIYKIKVKNGKVTSKKWLIKETYAEWGEYSRNCGLHIKGKYLYYVQSNNGTRNFLYRVNTTNGKSSVVTSRVLDYAIKGKKIYVEHYDEESPKITYSVMKLNGKSEKKISVKPKMTLKSKCKGYYAIYKTSGTYVKTYLKTPKGKYYIGKVRETMG